MPPLVEYGSDSDAYEEPSRPGEALKAAESSQDEAHMDEGTREDGGTLKKARESKGVAKWEARNDEEFRDEARKDGKRKNRGLKGDGFEGEVSLDEASLDEYRDRGREASPRGEAVGNTEGVQMGYQVDNSTLPDGWVCPDSRALGEYSYMHEVADGCA